MSSRKKFTRSRPSSRKEPMKPKRKPKFDRRKASYILEREAKNEAIENRRKLLEERQARQQANYSDTSSSEDEIEDVNALLNTFSKGKTLNKPLVLSDSESEESEDEAVLEDKDEQKNCSEQEVDTEGGLSDEDSVNGGEEIEIEDADSNEEEIEIEDADKNEEDEETAREDAGHLRDPKTLHDFYELDSELYETLIKVPVPLKTEKLKWPTIGNAICQIPHVKTKSAEPVAKKGKVSVLEDKCYTQHGKIPQIIKKLDWNGLYVKSSIQGNITKANHENIEDDFDANPSPLTPLQKELFSIINNYQDLLYAERTFDNESQIRFVYCLHVVNHLLKSRTKVLHHNAKIQRAKLTDMGEIPEEYKDQGLVRPKVLILVPFRYSCRKIVEMLISIFIGEDKGGSVINKKRFMEDFGGSEKRMPKKHPKPDDYVQIFKENTDDEFKIGISITKKALKLYSDFYSSDIIISSVLGLRTIIGAKGEEERDYDFLTSIELLVMDQTEVFFMQNWDHLLHIFEHMHLKPQDSHGTDFGRVRSWCVNGWSKYYRQTLIFSSIHLPDIHSIFNKKCFNYAGKVKVVNPVLTGSVAQVNLQVPQGFHRFNLNDYSKANNMRFEFFITKILPQFTDSIMNHTLIYVPSYFDYVKLRNHFRKEEFSFVQICEYSEPKKIAKARDMFFHSDAHCLLYTERFHFYHRITLKGIRHVIFYAPPTFPHFYSEMCRLMQEANQNPKSGSLSNMTVTTIYCKYDVWPLSAIVGSGRASRMITSDKTEHMIMTEK